MNEVKYRDTNGDIYRELFTDEEKKVLQKNWKAAEKQTAVVPKIGPCEICSKQTCIGCEFSAVEQE